MSEKRNLVIHPGIRCGTITIPSSKSIAHREIIASLLSGFDIRNNQIRGWSDDLRATRTCLKRLLNGKHEWPCKESGTTLRLLAPLAKVLNRTGKFIKEGRLAERPMLDFDFRSGEPLTLPGDISSQFISGILLAAPLIPWKSCYCDHLELKLASPLQSASYVKLTENILKDSGIVFLKPDNMTWHIPGWQTYRLWEGRGVVEGDWSQAAFFICMNQQIKIKGLNYGSEQGDRAVVDLMTADKIDASQIPDIVPALAAQAASKPHATVFTNCKRLRYKECDRLEAVEEMINSVGGCAEVVDNDTLVVRGIGRKLPGGLVKTFGDHRIAMSAAVLACHASGPIEIDDKTVVSKSYPKFWEDFDSLAVLPF